PTANVRVDSELFHWKQPGMPSDVRSNPGTSGASPNTISPSEVPAGISDVRSTTVLPSTGRGLPASVSPCVSAAGGAARLEVAGREGGEGRGERRRQVAVARIRRRAAGRVADEPAVPLRAHRPEQDVDGAGALVELELLRARIRGGVAAEVPHAVPRDAGHAA